MTFSHLNEQGQAVMVDVGEKQISRRTATARSIVSLPAEVLELRQGRVAGRGEQDAGG